MGGLAPARARQELQNEFTWSKSRHEKFEDCLRAYYFHYYASWGGWEAPPGSATRELYVLKKLSSRWQWAGSLVHAALEDLLRRARATGRFWTLDELLERTHRRARWQWRASREKSYWREASRIVGLVEHEYAEPVEDREWKRVWEEVVAASLRSFYASETFAAIQAVPRERWLTVDELDAWTFEGTKIWVAVDFAYADEDGTVHVLDWKTGQQRDVDHVQVGIYTLFAREKWGRPQLAPLAGTGAPPLAVANLAHRVLGELVYLGASAAQRVSVAADEEALEGCRDAMRRSIFAMQERLEDAPANRASADRFPVLPDRAACARCAFRRPCGRL